jgi:hypothetical protein
MRPAWKTLSSATLFPLIGVRHVRPRDVKTRISVDARLAEAEELLRHSMNKPRRDSRQVRYYTREAVRLRAIVEERKVRRG